MFRIILLSWGCNVMDEKILVSQERPFLQKLHTFGLAMLLVAIVGAGFALSYVTYVRLLGQGTAVSVETISELWETVAP